jgi:hypothetical protein
MDVDGEGRTCESGRDERGYVPGWHAKYAGTRSALSSSNAADTGDRLNVTVG